jgi:hypothetical protein
MVPISTHHSKHVLLYVLLHVKKHVQSSKAPPSRVWIWAKQITEVGDPFKDTSGPALNIVAWMNTLTIHDDTTWYDDMSRYVAARVLSCHVAVVSCRTDCCVSGQNVQMRWFRYHKIVLPVIFNGQYTGMNPNIRLLSRTLNDIEEVFWMQNLYEFSCSVLYHLLAWYLRSWSFRRSCHWSSRPISQPSATAAGAQLGQDLSPNSPTVSAVF